MYAHKNDVFGILAGLALLCMNDSLFGAVFLTLAESSSCYLFIRTAIRIISAIGGICVLFFAFALLVQVIKSMILPKT
ncbi:hypothetical protein [Paenibacillus sp. BC26]|uniref:hypothetical protein n=1 Tax=Paenibacillus sp. BC26 TaxID=1881032 RepID=UPI0008E8814F|nr:hypothetical protein [Paenibacillus sp. BC26]SFT28502.1 hypothetical protein SAMN05428962_6362 [Paenibacillus sp. BC26]